MKVRSKIFKNMNSVVIFLLLILASASQLMANPPTDTTPSDGEPNECQLDTECEETCPAPSASGAETTSCGCSADSGGAPANACLSLMIPFGQRRLSGVNLKNGMLKLKYDEPVAKIKSPTGITYNSPFSMYISNSNDSNITIVSSSGKSFYFSFQGSTGFMKAEASRIRVTKLDADRNPTTSNNPKYYQYYGQEISSVLFDANTKEVVEYCNSDGIIIKKGDYVLGGLEVLREKPDSNVETHYIKQIYSQISGLIDVTDINSDGYTIKIYNIADVGVKDSNGYYTVDSSITPRKEWVIKANNDDASNVDITEKVNGVNYLTNFVYIADKLDWVMTRDGGNVKVIKEQYKNGSITTEKLLTKDGNDNLIYAKNTVWKLFSNVGKRKISESIGEGADKLTTSYSYSMPEARYNYASEGSTHGGISYAVKSSKLVKSYGSTSMAMMATASSAVKDIGGNYGKEPYRKIIRFKADYSDYDKSSARLAKTQKPTGQWTSYGYRSDDGRKDVEYTGIGNASFSSYLNGTNTIKTQFLYDSVYPNDTFDVDKTARKIVKSANSNVISILYKGKYREGGYLIKAEEQAATPTSSVGAAENLKEKTLYYDNTSLFYNGDIRQEISQDGSIATYTYDKGSFNYNVDLGSSTFTTDATGNALKTTIIYGTEANPEGIAYKTLKKVIIKDSSANEVMNELYVYTGSGYEKIAWTVQEYNSSNQLVKKTSSNNAQLDQLWSCCNVSSKTDAEGKEFVYGYNTMKRKISETKKGVNGQADLVFNYTYDAQGNMLTETKTDGTKSLATTTEYDTAGRKVKEIDIKGRNTTWTYELGGRKVTETKPSGETIVIEKYKDGKIKSITGSDLLKRYYTYGYESGQSWEKVNYNTDNSLRWTKTTYNMLDQIIKTERSGYNGIVVSESFYNNKGYLIKDTTTGSADTLYVYDEAGRLFRKGLDIDGNGALDLASMDMIQEFENIYEKDTNGDWWLKRASKIYAFANNGVATTLSTTKNRVSGFTANKTAEVVLIDAYGNEAVSTTTIDRANKTLTQIINTSTSTINQEIVSVNGLTQSVKNQFGQVISYAYNAMGERTSQTDSVVGQTVYTYDNYGRKTQDQDPAGNITKYTYDADDNLISVENAQNKMIYYQYNNRGQAIRQWGDATYPLEKAYDAYGNLTQLKTYRADNGWNSATWPTSTGSADTTTWAYDEASGQLLTKTFADGKSTDYTYNVNGKLLTRKWARNDTSDARLTTSYSYDANTGSLLSTNYSDNTPSISYTYNRANNPLTVTDVVGTRTLNYNDKLALESEEITGLYNKTINYSYSTTGTQGLPTGINIGTEYVSNYGYDSLGRVSSVSAGSEVYSYSYKANSPLLDKYTTANGFERKYSYEADRYLLTDIENKFGTTNTISKYSFVNDSLDRRSSMTKNGSVYGNTAKTESYTYNNRSELINATSSVDTNFNFQYGFDALGNRTSYTNNGSTTSYATNNLNQYSSITANGVPTSPDYNEDGCMLNYDGWNYTYNGENRLVKAEKGIQKLEFKYDYAGRRVEKKVFENDTLTKHQKFVYNGFKLIEQLNALTNDNIESKFIWAGDNLLALQQGNTNYSYVADGNKNIRQLINSSTGGVVNSYNYSPFGKLINEVESVENPFKFSSEFADSETGLVYYNYRYYNPELGRWTKRDPIEEFGGWNLYNFTDNKVINNVDSLGLIDVVQVAEGVLDVKTIVADIDKFITNKKSADKWYKEALNALKKCLRSPKNAKWQECKCGKKHYPQTNRDGEEQGKCPEMCKNERTRLKAIEEYATQNYKDFAAGSTAVVATNATGIGGRIAGWIHNFRNWLGI